MLNHNIAAKALLVNDSDEILCLKRRTNDAHQPGTWDFPGGRLDEGESPFTGFQRECTEEIKLEVEVQNPLTIHHFTRDDGQKITMICFLCKLVDASQEVVLSEEHTEYKWLPVAEARKILGPFEKDVDAFEKYFLKK